LDPDLAEVPVEVIPNNSDRFVGFSIIYGLVVGNLGGSLQPGKEKFMILRIVFRIPTACYRMYNHTLYMYQQRQPTETESKTILR